MATELPRLNLTLPVDVMEGLQSLAGQRGETLSNVARSLLREALQRDEDAYYAQMVKTLDAEQGGKPLLTHKDVWAQFDS